jgi:hypothetical protein
LVVGLLAPSADCAAWTAPGLTVRIVGPVTPGLIVPTARPGFDTAAVTDPAPLFAVEV